jgi:hypothetical protein
MQCFLAYRQGDWLEPLAEPAAVVAILPQGYPVSTLLRAASHPPLAFPPHVAACRLTRHSGA